MEALWAKYKADRKAAGKTLMLKGSGFGGKGFKFNAQEAEKQGKARAKQAKNMGMTSGDGDDADDDDDDIFNKDKDINTEIDDEVGGGSRSHLDQISGLTDKALALESVTLTFLACFPFTWIYCTFG